MKLKRIANPRFLSRMLEGCTDVNTNTVSFLRDFPYYFSIRNASNESDSLVFYACFLVDKNGSMEMLDIFGLQVKMSIDI